MSFTVAYQTMMNRFAAQWAILQPTVEVAYPDVNTPPPEGESWVRVTILDGDSTQAALPATRRTRHIGIFMVEIYTPLAHGDELGRALADSVVTAMSEVTVSGIRLKVTSLLRVGEDRQWLHYNASTPFLYDD